jgi:succinylglutamate desuccinylase
MKLIDKIDPWKNGHHKYIRSDGIEGIVGDYAPDGSFTGYESQVGGILILYLDNTIDVLPFNEDTINKLQKIDKNDPKYIEFQNKWTSWYC